MYRTRSEKMRLYKKIAACVVIFILLFIVLWLVLSRMEDHYFGNQTESYAATVPDTVEYNGVTYIPKTNIETYLFMGIDSSDTVEETTLNDENTGQCDVLILLVRDISEGTYKTLTINRNTMAEVRSLDSDGTYLATTRVQLALAHANGDGGVISCENTVEAVSDFLEGQEIDGYVALNMGGISILNHLVGGVTVTIEDDFSECDPTLVMGETVTLNDEQAISYVRGRMTVGDGTNESRMRRQTAYLDGLVPLLIEKCAEDSTFPLEMYDELEDYLVTDIPMQKISKIALLLAEETESESLTIAGESSENEETGYAEFEADEDSLKQVIMELFYKEYE